MTAPAGGVTLLFTDLVSLAEMPSGHRGDAAGSARRAHFGLLRGAVAGAAGEEIAEGIKDLGDGLLVAFASAVTALQCAVSLQQKVEQHNRTAKDRLDVRVGLHAGEPRTGETDDAEAPVVVARRLCARASAGQILASRVVRDLVDERGGFRLKDVGVLALDDIGQHPEVVEVVWEAKPAPSAQPDFGAIVLPVATHSRFVGRERELGTLTAKLDAAESGTGGLVMIAGEPGVGKTRLATEAANLALERGWPVLYGRCYESEGMPSYIPFIEAFSGLLRELPREAAETVVSAAGPEMALLIPALRARFPDAPAPAFGDDNRYRLFQAVSDFLSSVSSLSSGGGVLLFLDDLHWADRPSLLLLQHIARRIAKSNILVVGTYRTVNLDRVHPLSETLATLSRERLYDRLLLSALSEAETGGLIESVAGVEAEPAVTAAVYRETSGNPFFIEEVVHHLLEQGRDLETPQTAVEEWGIPEGVKQVIGRRLSRLSDVTNRLLQVASVAGVGFELAVVEKAAGLDPDAATLAIEEAVNSGLVREQTTAYEFSHALVQETVHDEISLPRRQRLHLQLAEAIEDVHAANLAPHYAALAVHYREAGTSAPSDKTALFSQRAGEAALAVLAWEDAFRHFEVALELLRASGVEEPARRFDLLLNLLSCRAAISDPIGAVRDYGEEAFRIAESLNDADRLAHICNKAPRVLRQATGQESGGTPLYKRWVERVDLCAAEGTAPRVYADAEKAFVLIAEDRYREAFDLRRKAVQLARQLGDEDALIFAVRYHLMHPWPPEAAEERLALAEEFTERIIGVYLGGAAPRPENSVERSFRAHTLRECGLVWLDNGDRARAEDAFSKAGTIGSPSRQPIDYLNQLRVLVALAMVDGRFDEAMALSDEFEAFCREYGNPVYGKRIPNDALVYMGRFGDALANIDDVALVLTGMGGHAGADKVDLPRAVLLAYMGRKDEARTLLASILRRIDLGPEAMMPTTVLTGLLELAILLGDTHLMALTSERLRAVSGLLGTATFAGHPATVACTARLLGDAATATGNHDAAVAYYEQALAVCGKVGFRPETAITRSHLAEALWKAGRSRAVVDEHLDFAIAELEALEMAPWLGEALALRRRLDATPTKRSYPAGLSERQHEVLTLIAQGKTNSEIAQELVLSERTVQRHVADIYAKIGARNRAEATAFALAHLPQA